MKKNKKVEKVLVAGTFDFFHEGHQKFLAEAISLGKKLFVIVARDINVLKIKKFLPIESEKKRKKNIEKWAKENFPEQIEVFLGTQENFLSLPQAINPEIIALGYDQKTPKKFFTIFQETQIVRLSPYFPEKFKSRFFREIITPQ